MVVKFIFTLILVDALHVLTKDGQTVELVFEQILMLDHHCTYDDELAFLRDENPVFFNSKFALS